MSTFILAKSFNEYICEEPLVVLIPKHLKKFLFRMVIRNNFTIEVSRRDSWQVEVTFKFDYEARSASHVLSHMRHQLESTLVWGGISFNKYSAMKHFINPNDMECNVDISNLNGVASFSVKENNIISTNVGDAGVPYCSVSGKQLSLFNKDLGAKINCFKIEFLNKDNKLASFVDRDSHKMVIEINETCNSH